MNQLVDSRWLPIVLLTFSNMFMTFAWYGHLRYKGKTLLFVIVTSWGVAFFEYLLQVPANRWGSNVYTPAQLKIIQEVITLVVFCAFAITYLGEKSAGITLQHSCARSQRWRSRFCHRNKIGRDIALRCPRPRSSGRNE
jgi:uncharacterized protein (DUF486 family)